MRPFPASKLAEALKKAKAAAVLEKDISFGNEGTVYTDLNSALFRHGVTIPTYDFIGGLGGRNISAADIENIFAAMENGSGERINFIGIEVDGQ